MCPPDMAIATLLDKIAGLLDALCARVDAGHRGWRPTRPIATTTHLGTFAHIPEARPAPHTRAPEQGCVAGLNTPEGWLGPLPTAHAKMARTRHAQALARDINHAAQEAVHAMVRIPALARFCTISLGTGPAADGQRPVMVSFNGHLVGSSTIGWAKLRSMLMEAVQSIAHLPTPTGPWAVFPHAQAALLQSPVQHTKAILVHAADPQGARTTAALFHALAHTRAAPKDGPHATEHLHWAAFPLPATSSQ